MQDKIPDALINAFERHYAFPWSEPTLRNERLAWRAAWAEATKPCLHQIQEPAAAEQAAWHAGLDEGRAQAAPAAVAVPNQAQIKALMRKHRIWIEHSTLFEDDEPPRELRAVQAEQHQFEAFAQDLIALAATPAADAKPFLSEDDLDDLRRFEGMASDGESYDIAKKRIKRLAELGVVRWVGGSRYCMTAFGQYVLKCWDHLPLETHEEANARVNAEFRARIDRLNAEAITAQAAVKEGAQQG